MADPNDQRLHALSALVHLQAEARKAETQAELSFIFVNDIRTVLASDQVWFWLFDEFGRPRIKRAANVSDIDPDALPVRWTQELIEWCVQQEWHAKVVDLDASQVPEKFAADWAEHLSPQVLYIPMVRGRGGFIGGLLLASRKPWLDGHKALAELVADAFSHAWLALAQPDHKKLVVEHLKRYWRRYVVAAVVLLLFPVRQYVLAPAEVIPVDPVVVSAPLSGAIKDVAVRPNQLVQPGETLFVMEDTELSNRLNVAQRAYEVAEAEYLKNAQASFGCDECLARAAELRAVLEREKAQVDWASDLLARSRVVASSAGVAVFSDENDWIGRPVNVGQRVMTLANPEQTRLRLLLPVDDAIAIEQGAAVVFYPNAAPLSSFDAEITQTSYEAQPVGDQLLAYPLIADFDQGNARLGMRGTAKIYGDRAPIIYLIVRKPLAWARQMLGW